MTNDQAPDTTTVTTATASPAEPLVITVANTTERKQLPLERLEPIGILAARSLAIATATATLVSLTALLAPAYQRLAVGGIAGATLLGVGVKSAYKGKTTVTDALVASAVLVGLASATLQTNARTGYATGFASEQQVNLRTTTKVGGN